MIPSAEDIELDIHLDESASTMLRAPLVPAELESAVNTPWHTQESGERVISDTGRMRSGLVSWRPSATLPTVTTYGRFDVLGSIGRGGMAEILLARERATGGMSRHVVLKRILPNAAEDDEYVRMFQDEARLMMTLTHPNLCHVYDFGEESGTWYIAMEWVNGVSLAKMIRVARDSGGVPWQIAARVIAHVAEAVSYAHNARDPSGRPLDLVHRDVSPQNVMVAYDGTVKLLDFGIAKTATRGELTTSGLVKGKLPYMAPEQLANAPVDARTDVFALGICLYEALTGEPLYARGSEVETLRSMLQDAPPSLCAALPDVPLRLDRIVRTALERDPNDRFQSALEMQLALEEHLAQERQVVNAARIATFIREQFTDQLQTGPTLGGVIEIRNPSSVSTSGQQRAPDASAVDAADLDSLLPKRRSLYTRGSFAAIAIVIAIAGAFFMTAETTPRASVPTDRSGEERTPIAQADPPSATSPSPPSPAEPTTNDIARAVLGSPAGAETNIDQDSEAGRVRDRARPSKKQAGDAAPASRISINTRPWSKVFLGRRLLGTTPIAEARVPSGRVQLRFVDRDGETHRRQVRVSAGDDAQVFFDLRAE